METLFIIGFGACMAAFMALIALGSALPEDSILETAAYIAAIIALGAGILSACIARVFEELG